MRRNENETGLVAEKRTLVFLIVSGLIGYFLPTKWINIAILFLVMYTGWQTAGIVDEMRRMRRGGGDEGFTWKPRDFDPR